MVLRDRKPKLGEPQEQQSHVILSSWIHAVIVAWKEWGGSAVWGCGNARWWWGCYVVSWGSHILLVTQN
jgi:hypothetical protein